MICLEEMTEAGFDEFLDRRADAKVRESAGEDGVSAEEAKARARRSLSALFTEGQATNGNLFRSIKDASAGTVFGHIWLKLNHDDSLFRGEIHDFTVYDGFRRKGHGSQAMAGLVQYARAKGMTSLLIWLATGKDAGRAFCQKCGFKVIGAFMSKEVTDGRLPSRVALEGIRAEELKTFVDEQVKRKAKRSARDLGISQADALLAARREYEEHFSDGVVPEGEHVLSVLDIGTKSPVGRVWFGIHQAGPIHVAFIEDFLIHEACRGRGYGLQTLLALEQRAMELGAKEISLFVQAHNIPAQRLYTKANFATGNTELEKSLIVEVGAKGSVQRNEEGAQHAVAGYASQARQP